MDAPTAGPSLIDTQLIRKLPNNGTQTPKKAVAFGILVFLVISIATVGVLWTSNRVTQEAVNTQTKASQPKLDLNKESAFNALTKTPAPVINDPFKVSRKRNTKENFTGVESIDLINDQSKMIANLTRAATPQSLSHSLITSLPDPTTGVAYQLWASNSKNQVLTKIGTLARNDEGLYGLETSATSTSNQIVKFEDLNNHVILTEESNPDDDQLELILSQGDFINSITPSP